MTDILLPFLCGLGAAIISAWGVGGGTLLLLVMTLFLGVDQQSAQGINLLFFLPAAAIASFFRWKQGALEWKKVLPAVIAGCISAAIFAWLSRHIDIALIKKLFGFLLLATGVRELFYRARKAK